MSERTSISPFFVRVRTSGGNFDAGMGTRLDGPEKSSPEFRLHRERWTGQASRPHRWRTGSLRDHRTVHVDACYLERDASRGGLGEDVRSVPETVRRVRWVDHHL